MSKVSMTAVYPSIEEILPIGIKRRLNPAIIQEVTERYAKLGPKYVGPLLTDDGRRVNKCMQNDSARDAQEEIVDAIFNTCVLLLKKKYNNQVANKVLRDLVGIYDALQLLREDT